MQTCAGLQRSLAHTCSFAYFPFPVNYESPFAASKLVMCLFQFICSMERYVLYYTVCQGLLEAVQHVVQCDTSLSCFLSSFLRCIDLSLFSHCTTSHNAGHFLRLILSPCLVIRDNCQLSQGTIRSITAKSMQALGLCCLFSSGRTTTWNGKAGL